MLYASSKSELEKKLTGLKTMKQAEDEAEVVDTLEEFEKEKWSSYLSVLIDSICKHFGHLKSKSGIFLPDRWCDHRIVHFTVPER